MKDGLNAQQNAILEEVERQIPLVSGLPEPDRSRCLTCLAYEYMLQDMEEKAFELLEKCDPGYFKEPMANDMQKDPSMNRIVMTILSKLIEIGYVKVRTADGKEE